MEKQKTQMSSPIGQIAAAVKEGLSLWRTYISTRQQAYNRQKDKRKDLAIRYAEESFGKVNILYEFIHENMDIPDNKKSEFNRINTLIYRLRDKFNKYD